MPSTATEKLTEVEDQVLDAISSTQEPVVSTVKKVVEITEARVPVLKIRVNDNLPQIQELVDEGFTFAEKVLKSQHKFVNEILEALKPVTDKVVESKPTPKPKAAKAA